MDYQRGHHPNCRKSQYALACALFLAFTVFFVASPNVEAINFGKTTDGGTLASGDKRFAVGPYSPATSGTMTSYSFIAENNGAFTATQFQMALYSDSAGEPSALLDQSAEGTTDDDTRVTVSSTGSYAVVGGVDYHIAIVFSNVAVVYFNTDTVAGKEYHLKNGVGYSLPTTWTEDADATGIAPIYATYTEASSPKPISIIISFAESFLRRVVPFAFASQ